MRASAQSSPPLKVVWSDAHALAPDQQRELLVAAYRLFLDEGPPGEQEKRAVRSNTAHDDVNMHPSDEAYACSSPV